MVKFRTSCRFASAVTVVAAVSLSAPPVIASPQDSAAEEIRIGSGVDGDPRPGYGLRRIGAGRVTRFVEILTSRSTAGVAVEDTTENVPLSNARLSLVSIRGSLASIPAPLTSTYRFESRTTPGASPAPANERSVFVGVDATVSVERLKPASRAALVAAALDFCDELADSGQELELRRQRFQSRFGTHLVTQVTRGIRFAATFVDTTSESTRSTTTQTPLSVDDLRSLLAASGAEARIRAEGSRRPLHSTKETVTSDPRELLDAAIADHLDPAESDGKLLSLEAVPWTALLPRLCLAVAQPSADLVMREFVEGQTLEREGTDYAIGYGLRDPKQTNWTEPKGCLVPGRNSDCGAIYVFFVDKRATYDLCVTFYNDGASGDDGRPRHGTISSAGVVVDDAVLAMGNAAFEEHCVRIGDLDPGGHLIGIDNHTGLLPHVASLKLKLVEALK